MRVVMLLRNPFTRDARVLREARSLAGAGHDVTVLALGAGGLPDREERDGFRVVRTVPAGRLAGPTILGAAGASSGARRVPRPGAVVWLRDELLSRRMEHAARAVPADVYHAHDLNTLRAAIGAGTVNGARVVYDAHELYPHLTGLSAGERERWARLERRLIGRADAVIAPSAARAAHLAETYGIPHPTVVMNCPPARSVPDPAAGPLAAHRRPGETLLVYAGGLTPNRGLEALVRAADRLDGCRLAIVGWGPLERELRAAAGDRVVFAGAVEPDDVVSVVAGADVGMVPYAPIGLNNVLAAPNKLFEYLHAGLGVVASDLPDIRRIVLEHDVGELFEGVDPAAMAAAVLRLTSDASRLAAVRDRARATAPAYTWERQAATLLELYARLQTIR